MIPLAEIKTHLRITHDDEDNLLTQLLETAIIAVEDYIDREIADPMAAPIRAAILLHIADLYENRLKQSIEKLYDNRTYNRLLNPYCKASI